MLPAAETCTASVTNLLMGCVPQLRCTHRSISGDAGGTRPCRCCWCRVVARACVCVLRWHLARPRRLPTGVVIRWFRRPLSSSRARRVPSAGVARSTAEAPDVVVLFCRVSSASLRGRWCACVACRCASARARGLIAGAAADAGERDTCAAARVRVMRRRRWPAAGCVARQPASVGDAEAEPARVPRCVGHTEGRGLSLGHDVGDDVDGQYGGRDGLGDLGERGAAASARGEDVE